jgi:tetratricopeptide (TPR) repeat protein/predicted Ser/Thr protein kinase
MQITPGLRLGPYRILKLLGSGGMGSVYLAYDERLERHVALKMLTRESREDIPRRILREARAAARLNHTNIAGLYDVFEHEHEAFLVMEYVDGEPLTALVKSQPVPVDRVLDIGLQLVEALRYAHSAGIIHRDVKPANVMVTPSGQVKVLDLGLARATPDPGADTRSESQSEIVPSRAGTPAYMAPERLGRHVADARTDVYSVGVVLFELLTGRRPYLAPDLMALAVNVATQPTPRVSQTRPDIPAALDEVVARAMAKEPSTRYASAAELYDALVDVRETMSGRFKPPPVDWRTRWRTGALIGVAAIAMLAIVLWVLFGRRPSVVPATGPLTFAIPPVINESTGQADVDELGSLLQSVVARNLAVLPEITLVPTQAPASLERAPAGQSPRAPSDTVTLTIRRMVAGFAADADFLREGDSRPVRRQFSGDELTLLRSVLDGLVTEFEQLGQLLTPAWRMADAERNQLRELPTKDRQALVSYLKGRALLGLSDDLKADEAAVAAFQDAIKRDGSFAFAYAGLSQAYWSTWKHSGSEPSWLDRAWDAATHAAAIDPKCDQARVALALVFKYQGRKNDAVSQAKLAVGLSPDNDDARRTLGLALFPDDKDAAVVELRAAVKLRPYRPVNHYYLGWGLLNAHRFQEAIGPLKEATDLLPTFESAWVNLGFAYLSVGDWEKASGSSSRALELNKDDSVALNNLAAAYYWDGKYELALQRFHEAAGLAPELPSRHMNLGDAFDALGRSRPARDAYAKAVDLATIQLGKKFDARTASIAAKCEAKLGHKAEAEKWASQAWQADDKNAEVVYKFAVVYALTGQREKALDKLELAVKQGKPLWEVRADPDLRSLRNEARFKNLAAKTGG